MGVERKIDLEIAQQAMQLCFLSGYWSKHTVASYWWMKAPSADFLGLRSCREDIWSQISSIKLILHWTKMIF
jgi:hypothetical protein